MKESVKFTGFICSCTKRFYSCFQIFNGLCRFQSCKFWFLSCSIFHGLQIQSKNFFFAGCRFCFFEKSLTGFITQPVILHHFIQPCRNGKHFFSFIIRTIICNSFCDFNQRVNTHHISSTECCRLWTANNGAC